MVVSAEIAVSKPGPPERSIVSAPGPPSICSVSFAGGFG
jgi:hypothetical protein